MEAIRQFAHQNTPLFCSILVCVWISLSLIGRMWLKYHRDSFAKKLVWSIVLCVPFFGWLFYAGMYTPPSENTSRVSVNADAWNGGR